MYLFYCKSVQLTIYWEAMNLAILILLNKEQTLARNLFSFRLKNLSLQFFKRCHMPHVLLSFGKYGARVSRDFYVRLHKKDIHTMQRCHKARLIIFLVVSQNDKQIWACERRLFGFFRHLHQNLKSLRPVPYFIIKCLPWYLCILQRATVNQALN